MKSIDDIVQEFHDNHEVEYVLMVKVDGEVLGKYTSGIDASDVSCESDHIDELVQKAALAEVEDKATYEEEAKAEAQMEEARLEKDGCGA